MQETHKLNREIQKDLSDYHHEYIEMQDTCALCGTVLEINVETYPGSVTLKEEAFCPSCNIKTRVKDHKIQ